MVYTRENLDIDEVPHPAIIEDMERENEIPYVPLRIPITPANDRYIPSNNIPTNNPSVEIIDDFFPDIWEDTIPDSILDDNVIYIDR